MLKIALNSANFGIIDAKIKLYVLMQVFVYAGNTRGSNTDSINVIKTMTNDIDVWVQ